MSLIIKDGLVIENIEPIYMEGTLSDVMDLLEERSRVHRRTHRDLELKLVSIPYEEQRELYLVGKRNPTYAETEQWNKMEAERKLDEEARERRQLKQLEELRKKYPEG